MKWKFIIGLAIIVSFGIALKFYFAKPSIPVVIKADKSPTKVKPEEPGGVSIPHANSLLFDSISHTPKRTVNLLQEPELPLRFNNEVTTSKTIDSIDQILANIDGYEAKFVKEEAPILESEALPEIIYDTNATIENQQPPKTNLNILKIAHNRYKLPKPSDPRHYKIQLASTYSRTDAQKVWANLLKKHPKYLGKANFFTKKVQIASGQIFYLVLAGEYQTHTEAQTICQKLIARKQNCIVLKP